MMPVLSFEALCAEVAAKRLPLAVHCAKLTQGGVFVSLPPSVAGVAGGQAETPVGDAEFLRRALAARPRAVLCHPAQLPVFEALEARRLAVPVPDVRAALGVLAGAYYGTSSSCPRVVGITGTNGKTTQSYLLEALYRSLGSAVGVLGTVTWRWPGHEEDAPLTTPGCLELHAMLAAMRDAGVGTVFMEVSSHALDQQRTAGVAFSGALLTNVTQDHLDYHGTMEHYFAAKRRLFTDAGALALNADDPYGRRLLAEHEGAVGYGLVEDPVPGSRHLRGTVRSLRPQGVELEMRFEGKTWNLSSPLVGRFNVMNLLGAQAMGLALGLRPQDLSALGSFTGVPGRLERIESANGRHVFVDYAHTPDALSKAISALKDAGFARVVTLFGCGGNRDRTKRPLMGEAVASLSDVAVLTSDNPRDEEPEAIIADVLPGLARCNKLLVEPDRKKALALALEQLGPDYTSDALLAAGKGHESYQLVKGVRHPFSDQAILRELLSCA